MYSFIRKLVYSTVRESSHQARCNLFFSVMRPRDGVSILDLGGVTGDFMARIKDRINARFIVADIGTGPLIAQSKYGFEPVFLEEDKPLPFDDKEIDIVFCNSVIEHVTLPKKLCVSERFSREEWKSRSFQSQRRFAGEIRRIGKSYFVQAPHKSFPIESHTWLPIVNWLNHNQIVSLVRFTDKYWVKHCGYVDWNLLGDQEMRTLFPDATIKIERLWGFPKSVIAFKPYS